MVRVLLAIDDYGELVYLQTLLKKIGFDVDGVQSQKKVDDRILSFNPELIIATSKGKRVNGLEIAEKLKRPRGTPKVLLLIPTAMAEKVRGFKLHNVDSFIESPVNASRLLHELASIMGLDGEQLIDKYRRMKQKLDPDNEEDVHLIKSDQESDDEEHRGPVAEGGETHESHGSSSTPPSTFHLKPSTLSKEERTKRMQTMLKKMDSPKADGFPQDVVKRFNKKIREEEDPRETEDLEEERQAFVKAMFKK